MEPYKEVGGNPQGAHQTARNFSTRVVFSSRHWTVHPGASVVRLGCPRRRRCAHRPSNDRTNSVWT
jgi:hypothetical protein